MAAQDGHLLLGAELAAGTLGLLGHEILLAIRNLAVGPSCSKRTSTPSGRGEGGVKLVPARLSMLTIGDVNEPLESIWIPLALAPETACQVTVGRLFPVGFGT
jgi:hypothetical protein